MLSMISTAVMLYWISSRMDGWKINGNSCYSVLLYSFATGHTVCRQNSVPFTHDIIALV